MANTSSSTGAINLNINIDLFVKRVVEKLSKQFPGLVRCVPLAGYLETTTLADVHSHTPGLFISAIGTGELTSVETGQNDLQLLMAAYFLLVNKNDAMQRETDTMEWVTSLVDYITLQRWGLPLVYGADAVESLDLHGLTKGFKSDTTSWRLGVSALARAADLYGGDNPISNLSLWLITWEQTLRTGKSIYPEIQKGLPAKKVIVKEDGQDKTIIYEPSMDLNQNLLG